MDSDDLIILEDGTGCIALEDGSLGCILLEQQVFDLEGQQPGGIGPPALYVRNGKIVDLNEQEEVETAEDILPPEAPRLDQERVNALIRGILQAEADREFALMQSRIADLERRVALARIAAWKQAQEDAVLALLIAG